MNTHYIRLKLYLSRIECSALKGRPETLISSTFARLIPNLRIPKGCRSKTPRAIPRKHRYPRPDRALELPGEFPAGSDELTAPEAPVSQTDSDLDEKNLKRARRPAEPENQEPRKVSLTQQRQNRPGMHPTASKLRRRSRAGAAARPASPVVSIDERPSVETEADKARNDLLDLVESPKDQTDPDRDHSGHRTPR